MNILSTEDCLSDNMRLASILLVTCVVLVFTSSDHLDMDTMGCELANPFARPAMNSCLALQTNMTIAQSSHQPYVFKPNASFCELWSIYEEITDTLTELVEGRLARGVTLINSMHVETMCLAIEVRRIRQPEAAAVNVTKPITRIPFKKPFKYKPPALPYLDQEQLVFGNISQITIVQLWYLQQALYHITHRFQPSLDPSSRCVFKVASGQYLVQALSDAFINMRKLLSQYLQVIKLNLDEVGHASMRPVIEAINHLSFGQQITYYEMDTMDWLGYRLSLLSRSLPFGEHLPVGRSPLPTLNNVEAQLNELFESRLLVLTKLQNLFDVLNEQVLGIKNKNETNLCLENIAHFNQMINVSVRLASQHSQTFGGEMGHLFRMRRYLVRQPFDVDKLLNEVVQFQQLMEPIDEKVNVSRKHLGQLVANLSSFDHNQTCLMNVNKIGNVVGNLRDSPPWRDLVSKLATNINGTLRAETRKLAAAKGWPLVACPPVRLPFWWLETKEKPMPPPPLLKSTTQKSTATESTTQRNTTQAITTQNNTSQAILTKKSTTPATTTQKNATQDIATKRSTNQTIATGRSTTQAITTATTTTPKSTSPKTTNPPSTAINLTKSGTYNHLPMLMAGIQKNHYILAVVIFVFLSTTSLLLRYAYKYYKLQEKMLRNYYRNGIEMDAYRSQVTATKGKNGAIASQAMAENAV